MASAVLCLDFEASGLGPQTYPIEVALADPASGHVTSWLIKPAPAWREHGDWQAEAEALHGLSRAQIEAEGLPVATVAAELTAAASGAVILSDAPAHDGQWLRLLYRAVGLDRPPFELGDFGRFAWQCASRAGRRPDIAYVKAEAEAWALFPVTHRAAADARHNAEILRQIGLSV
jgi:hypothetical protein